MTVQGKTIWVTDAGSALGAGLVDGLAAAGNFVIASGDDEATLGTLVARSRGAVAALPIDDVGRRWGAAAMAPRLAEFTDRLDIVVCGGAASEVRGAMPAGAFCIGYALGYRLRLWTLPGSVLLVVMHMIVPGSRGRCRQNGSWMLREATTV